MARCILEAITTSDYRLRWRVGKDAGGFTDGRRRISDEEWVAMGRDLSDAEYNKKTADYFGIELRSSGPLYGQVLPLVAPAARPCS